MSRYSVQEKAASVHSRSLKVKDTFSAVRQTGGKVGFLRNDTASIIDKAKEMLADNQSTLGGGGGGEKFRSLTMDDVKPTTRFSCKQCKASLFNNLDIFYHEGQNH
jgi:hypothetical protein